MSHPAWQKMWLRTHWCLGLFVGFVFVLSGVTGSTLVFYQAIDEWLNPERLIVAGSGPYRSFDEMVAAARAARQDLIGPDDLLMPVDGHGVVVAEFRSPAERPHRFHTIEVTIDPYTATVLSHDRVWGDTFVSVLYEVHRGWLLEETGETLVGICGLLLLLSVGTGLYLWWPKAGRGRQAITFNPNGSTIRRCYDLHKLSGVVGSIVLLVLAFTGLYLEFPDYFIALVEIVSPVSEEVTWHSTVSQEARPITVDHAVAIAKERFPTAELKWIGLPQHADDVVQIGLRQPEEVRRTSGESIVRLDQYNGAVLGVRDWRLLAGGTTFLAWLFPLHNGEALGIIGRIIVFVTGFVPLILYVTGVRMWWLKRVARRRQKQAPEVGMTRISINASPTSEERLTVSHR
ncbi:MAG: PepSY-associated TM helix domain-containing protein [Nitrospirota bacterium]